MFIQKEDYKVVIGDAALDVLSRIDPANLANAEAEAREEIASYLRPKYDCAAIFAAEGEARNRLAVMYTVDVALHFGHVLRLPKETELQLVKKI